MTSETELPPGIEPEDVVAADHQETLTDADGLEWLVLVSMQTGDRELVNPDIVDYSKWTHPALGGFIGFLALAGTFFASIMLGVLAIGFPEGTLAILPGYILARIVLYHTPFGDQLFRFMEWNDHKSVIIATRQAGEQRGETL